MYRILSVLFLLAMSAGCQSQPSPVRGEFATNSNGLMYGDNDMKALRFIVDSLNLRFKSCDLDKTYYSNRQTRTYRVTFKSESNSLLDIIEDMKKNMSFEELAKKYSHFIQSVDSSALLIKLQNGSFLSGAPGQGYTQFNPSGDNSFETTTSKNKWVYKYSGYSKSYALDCRFFAAELKQQVIPDEYARLIQYVDCMIDTNSVIYLTRKSGWDDFELKSENYSVINAYITKAMKIKKKGKDDWEYAYITSEKLTYAIDKLKNDPVFIELVKEAADECIKTKKGNDELEILIAAFVSKQTALTLKRSRRVIGMCSQDESPRVHALNIATLAAEAHAWDIFLRAHLDIMNDRFERMSDGSYAWGERKTYLKELEELDLNIVDLMLGLTLRASNIAANHYYGTIWRMGWALTESKEKDGFEKKAFAMMKDDRLDEFNRGLVFLLYKTYLSYLDEKEALQKVKLLKDQVSSFPDFMQPSINAISEKKTPERR